MLESRLDSPIETELEVRLVPDAHRHGADQVGPRLGRRGAWSLDVATDVVLWGDGTVAVELRAPACRVHAALTVSSGCGGR